MAENGQISGPRTLTVSFAPGTRTTLDGLQPKWKEGDKIILANDNSFGKMETYTVTKDDAGKTSIVIPTYLYGPITAVYPASAAIAYGNIITGIKVSKTPDGTFASANICMAKTGDNGNILSFANMVAIIKVEVPTSTKKLTLTSLEPIVSSGKRASSGAVPIASGGSTVITVGDGSSNIPNPCYVSILAPATGAALLQDINVDLDDKAQGGFSPSAIAAKGKSPSSYAFEANTIYTLSKESLHDYVLVNGLKWATMNVGASSPTDCGNYFAWGEIKGHTAVCSGEGAFTEDFANFDHTDSRYTGTWDSVSGFADYNSPYWNGFSYSKYTDSSSELLLSDDAAFWNWGGAWRMPGNEELYDILSDASYSEGYITHNGVIFPAAGYGDGTFLKEMDGSGYYWIKMLGLEANAAYYSFNNGVLSQSFGGRYLGMCVRPVSGVLIEKPSDPNPDPDPDPPVLPPMPPHPGPY